MKFFRNPEIKKEILIYCILTGIAVIIGFVLGPSFGILSACLCLAFGTVHFIVTHARYRRITALTCEIDRILHGREKIDIQDYGEGELAILQNEIYKMTVRMREQADVLKSDKAYLADSLADISHQVRTPLTSINLIVSFLSEPDIEDARRQELAKELIKLLTRIDWLISTLLKISKLDTGAVQFKSDRVLVCELIKKASEPLAVPMDLRGQHLRVCINGDTAFCGDLHWTSEAVGNIIKNCMENTPSGGIIEIAASENALYTELVITDNGSGIDEADLPHIFERFYKGKNSSEQSAGIGLALSRMIIAAQNGILKAENRKEGGARFTIRFYRV